MCYFEVGKNIQFTFWRQKDIIKSICYVFTGYKQRNKVWLLQNYRKNIFRDKEATIKARLMFLDDKVLTEREQLQFRSLLTKKEAIVYAFYA